MHFATQDDGANDQSDGAKYLVRNCRERLRYRQGLERKHDPLNQVGVRHNGVRRKLQRLLKRRPGEEPAKEVQCIVPMRTTVAESRVEDAGKDDRENCYHHYRRQQGPEDA